MDKCRVSYTVKSKALQELWRMTQTNDYKNAAERIKILCDTYLIYFISMKWKLVLSSLWGELNKSLEVYLNFFILM